MVLLVGRQMYQIASPLSTFLYPFHECRLQDFQFFADKGLSDSVLVQSAFPGVRAAISAAASVGGNGDFCQRSGNKSDIERNAFKSLNRYKTSTK